jgi:hypothetical protein
MVGRKKELGSGVMSDFYKVVEKVITNYRDEATTRTKLIDGFLVFLVVLGVLQFVFCVLVGTFVCTMMCSIWRGKLT